MEIRRVDNVNELAALSSVATLTPEQRVEQSHLVRAVEAVNKAQIFGDRNELTFSLDRHTKKPVMKLVDKETQEVIRQIPPEYILRLAEESSS